MTQSSVLRRFWRGNHPDGTIVLQGPFLTWDSSPVEQRVARHNYWSILYTALIIADRGRHDWSIGYRRGLRPSFNHGNVGTAATGPLTGPSAGLRSLIRLWSECFSRPATLGARPNSAFRGAWRCSSTQEKMPCRSHHRVTRGL